MPFSDALTNRNKFQTQETLKRENGDLWEKAASKVSESVDQDSVNSDDWPKDFFMLKWLK